MDRVVLLNDEGYSEQEISVNLGCKKQKFALLPSI